MRMNLKSLQDRQKWEEMALNCLIIVLKND